MPIKPLSISSYSAIPDEEDVTPLDGSSGSEISKKSNTLLLVFGLLFSFALVACVYFGINYFFDRTRAVTIYQTSLSRKEGIHLMTIADINELSGRDINKIEFGNANCKNCPKSSSNLPTGVFNIDTSKKYQKIIGFGGAFTEATAYNFNKLPTQVQEQMIDLYFGFGGIGLSLGRIHINSCDFSLSSYSFDELKDDFELQFFDIEVTHDNAYIIPLIRYAMEVASRNKRPIQILVFFFFFWKK
jgi:hypothetical protein